MSMTTAAPSLRHMLRNRDEVIRQREGDRLARLLRVLFGTKLFGFKWIFNEQTSYTDGKDIYILYDLQHDQCRPFTPAELRVLRKAHAIHERGHIEFDVLQAYGDWKRALVTKLPSEWKANLKYPMNWLTFFGNMTLDGRMERLVMLTRPSTKIYLDFSNYEWRFGIRGEHAGTSQLQDFRECYASRVLGMTDIAGWDEEAVALVDSVQPLIEQARIATSTADCLEIVTTIMRDVWPTVLEWMDDQEESPEDFQYEHGDDHDASDVQWGEADDVEVNTEHAQRIIVKTSAGSNKPEEQQDEQQEQADSSTDPSSSSEEGKQEGEAEADAPSDKKDEPDLEAAVRQEENALENDEKELEKELGEYQDRKERVTIEENTRLEQPSISEEIMITPYLREDHRMYEQVYQKVKRFVGPTSRALQELLAPIQDEVRRNQRSGKVQVNRVWRAEKLGETNVFERRTKGTPKKEAAILLGWDVSGSTDDDFGSHRRVDEMKQAAVLMTEACERVDLPIGVYGYTEYGKCVVHPFKPFGRFGALEKGILGGVEPECGNRDTLALQWFINQMAARTEDVRLLIMLSDGMPVFEEHENEDTIRHLVLDAEKKGIDVLCLFVGPKFLEEKVRYMYPERAIIVNQHLSKELGRHVKRIIRKRRG